jgi:hypothetical protein
MQKTSMMLLGAAVALSPSCGRDSGDWGGDVVTCIAVEPTDEPTDQIDEYSAEVQRSSVRTAGPDELLAPPTAFADCARERESVDLIDENGRHVWFAYGAQQDGEAVDVPPLPTLTNASLRVSSSWGWVSYMHVEVSESGQLLLALQNGGLLGADGLDVVAESAGLPAWNSCGTETEQRLRFNGEVSVDNGTSAALTIDGAPYTVTNLWTIDYDNWQCEDVPNGVEASWIAWRD